MFCDLVGSTALSQRLDPEDLRRTVLTYQESASEIIKGFEGHVAQYLGDGLLVYFGYPVAHEDDAERAIRAALAMLDALPALNERLAQDNAFFRDEWLRVRVGIHTGLVVAGERSREAVARAEALEHPHSLAVALDFAIALHEFRGEIAEAETTARAAIRLSEAHGFPFWMALAKTRLGWAMVAAGQSDGGIGEIQSGLASHRATGAELARPFLLGLLADACTTAGRIDDARAALSAAMTAGQTTDERFYVAELERLDGELRVREKPGGAADAEMLFRQAIDTTRAQHARSLELRAATSLARLWQAQGRPGDAHGVLAGITASFDEGRATRDVEEARQLLAALP